VQEKPCGRRCGRTPRPASASAAIQLERGGHRIRFVVRPEEPFSRCIDQASAQCPGRRHAPQCKTPHQPQATHSMATIGRIERSRRISTPPPWPYLCRVSMLLRCFRPYCRCALRCGLSHPWVFWGSLRGANSHPTRRTPPVTRSAAPNIEPSRPAAAYACPFPSPRPSAPVGAPLLAAANAPFG